LAVHGDVQLSSDGRGRLLVVTGYHYGADAGTLGEIDRISYLFARGIYHADETQEHQLLLDMVINLYPLLLGRERTEGDAEGTQRIGGELLGLGLDLCPALIG
jgi:hypothetical protein